jgi:hypothetical protein
MDLQRWWQYISINFFFKTRIMKKGHTIIRKKNIKITQHVYYLDSLAGSELGGRP